MGKPCVMDELSKISLLLVDAQERVKKDDIQIATPLELMEIRAAKAEDALKHSNEEVNSLKVNQEDNLKVIQKNGELIANLKTTIARNNAVESDEVHRMAFLDPLTGLPNRRLLDDRLSQMVLNNKRRNSYSAAIFVDLDKFKLVNDLYGHETGDDLLIAVSNRLKKCIRESDTVARYGGDEFVVLLDHLDVDLLAATKSAHLIASNILDELTPAYTLHLREGKRILKTMQYECFSSLGVAMFDGLLEDKGAILDRADKAMYLSKSEGGKTIRFAI